MRSPGYILERILFSSRLIGFCLGLLAAVIMAGVFTADILEPIEALFIDLRYQFTDTPMSDEIVLVAIDQNSLRELPHWPWPRKYHAQAIDVLAKAGARVIAFDVDFSSRSSIEQDAVLAESMRRAGNVVLSVFTERKSLPNGLAIEYAMLPLPELRRRAAALGSIHLYPDLDGRCRTARFFEEVQGEVYPSLANLLAFLGAPKRPPGAETGLAALPGKTAAAPFYIDYSRPGRGPRVVSFSDLIQGRVPVEHLRDRVALIGATAVELHDVYLTPWGEYRPGAEIHAHIINTIWRSSYIGRGTKGLALSLLLVFCLLQAFALSRLRWHQIFAEILIVTGLLAVLGVYFFVYHRFIIEISPLLGANLLIFFAMSLYHLGHFESQIRVKNLNLAAFFTVGELNLLPGDFENASSVMRHLLRRILRTEDVDIAFTERNSGKLKAEKNQVGPAAPEDEDGEPYALRALSTGETIIVEPDRSLGKALRDNGRSRIFVPMLSDEGAKGVISASRMGMQQFGEEEAKFLYGIAVQLGFNRRYWEIAQDLQETFLSAIQALAVSVDARDKYTGGHCERVTLYSMALGRELRLTEGELEILQLSSWLHDIGKIGVPELVLNKPGRLTEAEYRIIQDHTVIGKRIVERIKGEKVQQILPGILSHHERLDGKGYPQGLAGKQIPRMARIIAVADVWDAMSSDRPYRAGLTPEEAATELSRSKGTQLEGEMVEAFLGNRLWETPSRVKSAAAAEESPEPLS